MIGGTGNDKYYVDSADDVVIEDVIAGSFDMVYSNVSYTLAVGQQVEFLATNNNAGTGSINLTGNEFANTLNGNAGSNILTGEGGGDSIDGMGGTDTMIGGIGNDKYYVDSADDVVIEDVVAGSFDMVYASASYTLATGQQIEQLATTNNAGTDSINLTGNTIGNTLIGNAGTNLLRGGLGNDTLWGGAGSDIFQFDTTLHSTSNRDNIMDYSIADDTIALENAIFTLLTATGVLAEDLFKDLSLGVQDAGDFIIYDRANGNLSYDTNGLTAGGQTVFAHVTNGLALTFDDFLVV